VWSIVPSLLPFSHAVFSMSLSVSLLHRATSRCSARAVSLSSRLLSGPSSSAATLRTRSRPSVVCASSPPKTSGCLLSKVFSATHVVTFCHHKRNFVWFCVCVCVFWKCSDYVERQTLMLCRRGDPPRALGSVLGGGVFLFVVFSPSFLRINASHTAKRTANRLSSTQHTHTNTHHGAA
jgi:hypothetical protein